jgi:hypothetical protein
MTWKAPAACITSARSTPKSSSRRDHGARQLRRASGFGFDKGKQGIYATFSAFLEMCVSEITMARLNHCNVLAHFSHSGVDDMADNTCHFGINSMFADGGLDHEQKDTPGCTSPPTSTSLRRA